MNFLFCIITTLILMVTALGRTPLVGALKPFLQKTFKLSSVSISAVYTLGSLVAGLCVLGVGGYIYRRYTVARLFLLAFLGFAMVPTGLYVLTINHACLDPSFVLICLVFLFFLMRFIAQGLVPLFLRNVTASHCKSTQQSWLSALHMTSLTLSVGGVTYLFASVQNKVSWPTIWFVQVAILLLLGLGSYVYFSSKHFSLHPGANLRGKIFPQRSNLGSVSVESSPTSAQSNKILFFCGAVLLGLHQLQATGISFHMADFARESNLDFKTAFSLFLYISIMEIILNFFCGWLCNRCSLRVLLVFLSICLLSTAFCLKILNTIYGATGFILFSAGSWSLNHILAYILSPRLVSKDDVPNGNALIIGVCTFCSAMGPFALSLGQKFFGSFFFANITISALLLFPLFVCFIVKRR